MFDLEMEIKAKLCIKIHLRVCPLVDISVSVQQRQREYLESTLSLFINILMAH